MVKKVNKGIKFFHSTLWKVGSPQVESEAKVNESFVNFGLSPS